MQPLTKSRLAEARRCDRRYDLLFNQRWRSTDIADSLRFGTLLHSALEGWWRTVQAIQQAQLTGDQSDNPLVFALAAIERAHCDPFDAARARQLMLGYHCRWLGEMHRFGGTLRVIDVEREFRCQHVNPDTGAASRTWRLAGKIDAVARNERGELVIIEHKTSSEDTSPGSNYWRRLKIDSQLGMYFIGASDLYGERPAYAIYDVVAKVQLRPGKATPEEQRKYKKDGTLYAAQREQDETPAEYEQRVQEAIAEAPERYYARCTVTRTDEELADFREQAWQVGLQLQESARHGRWPRNDAGCSYMGRYCEFFPVCTGEGSLGDPYQFHRIPTSDPELTLTEEDS